MKTQTPTKQRAHRLAAVLAIITALATTGAWAWDSYYWTGATSTDYHTAGNWNSNHVAVATDIPHWRFGIDQRYETADIVSYRIDIAQNASGRGGWFINAGTEAQPLELPITNTNWKLTTLALATFPHWQHSKFPRRAA